jgi:hypothetical protein
LLGNIRGAQKREREWLTISQSLSASPEHQFERGGASLFVRELGAQLDEFAACGGEVVF